MSPVSGVLGLRAGALSLSLTLALSRRVGARAASSEACGQGPSYTQGQSPEPKTREYFYYVDHQGQLFLDDAKVKNFITCFKDQKFLVFFFSRLRKNQSGRYEDAFPFVSLCGRERNFVRCEDLPVVFTHLLADGPGPARLSYGGGGEALAVPFEPARLMPLPANGRLYHPAPQTGWWCGAGPLFPGLRAQQLLPVPTRRGHTAQPYLVARREIPPNHGPCIPIS